MFNGTAMMGTLEVQQRVKDCGLRWHILPDAPGHWAGEESFLGCTRCASKPKSASREADVCLHPRTSFFAKCNVSVILPHKSASSMLLGQFEDICGKPTEQIGGHFIGEHVQDRLPTNTSEGAARRLDGANAAQLEEIASARNGVSKSSGCGEHKSADPNLSRGGLLVFFYNMLEAADGASPFMNPSDYDRVKMVDARIMNRTEPNGVVKRVPAPPSEKDVIWRFSKFLGWLKSRPFLNGRYVHFSPQAWYAGVACSRGQLASTSWAAWSATPKSSRKLPVGCPSSVNATTLT